MNNYEIIDKVNSNLEEVKNLNSFVDFSLNYLKLNNVIFNIIIVDKDKIQYLNKTYRNIDRVTDVISFALEDDDSFIKTDFRVLGDIYICLDKAIEQAKEYGHSLKREISFLTIHGILHLLGYDHMLEDEEKEMFGLQEMILNEYGLKR